MTKPETKKTTTKRLARTRHNESAGRDRRRTRRINAGLPVLAAAGAAAASGALLGVEPVIARIALNHNESPATDLAR